jgi:hypothetical protein
MQVVKIAAQFNIGSEPLYDRPISKLSRNERFLVDLTDGTSIVLQKINSNAFPDPVRLVKNSWSVANYIAALPDPAFHHTLFPTLDERQYFTDLEGFRWIAYRFVDGFAPEEKNAGVAAMLGHAVGEFHRTLTDFPVEALGATLPNYHNTPHYYRAFEDALSKAPNNISGALPGEIGFVKKQFRNASGLLEMGLAARVTHNNVTLGNLLLDNETGLPKGLINYDSVMPGIIAFDFGQGAMSCCYEAKSDETDMNRVSFDMQMFDAYSRAFISKTHSILEENEPASLALGSVIMTLEAGMRYLTAYLSNSTEFTEEYDGQNLNRARVLLYLSMQMQEKYAHMCAVVKNAFIL